MSNKCTNCRSENIVEGKLSMGTGFYYSKVTEENSINSKLFDIDCKRL